MESDNKTTILTHADETQLTAAGNSAAGDADATRVIDQSNEYREDDVEQRPAIGIGSIIKNRFTLHELLGSGGMGQVYRAVDLRKKEAEDDNPYIAIKLLGGDFARHPAAFVTLQREAKKTQTLAHPNIVTVYDFDRDDSIVFMTMEELRGVSLDKMIREEPPTRKQALKIIRDIAIGLSYAHSKGFVHSDLKPGNIFVTDTGQIKILDFGIARAVGLEHSTDKFDAASLGALTPKYASLEMFEGARPDPRDDIYALGIIACELLGSGHPYRGKTAQQLKTEPIAPVLPNTGRLLRRLLQTSVAVHATDRLASVELFIKRFDFANSGYKKAIAAAVVAVSLAIGNLIYWYYFADNYPALSTLPLAQQQQFHHSIDEANGALAAGDINGALFYLDDAYAIHKKDKAIETLTQRILHTVEQSADANSDARQQLFDTLKEHPVFKESLKATP